MNHRPKSPFNCFWKRGGAWVICQAVLMLGVILLAFLFRSSARNLVVFALGIGCMSLGAFIGIAGAMVLRKSLTPFPEPLPNARLIRNGIYSKIRHPLYTSVILGSIGWAITWQSWPALVAALVLIPFFIAKANQEEQSLRKQFPEYADYARTTKRFLPWVY